MAVSKTSKDVYVGRDNWLFLVGGSNTVLDMYTENSRFLSIAKDWVSLIKARAEICARFGAVYRHVLVPDKLSIYPEMYEGSFSSFSNCPSVKLPKEISDFSEPNISHLLINLFPPMLSAKGERDVYYKTDSHWTPWGCYISYTEICKNLDVSPVQDILERPTIRGKAFLDLGGKVDPQISEDYITVSVIKDAERVGYNKIVKFKEENNLHNEPGLHVGSVVVYNNSNAPDKRKLILFGDSYSEYRGHLLTGMLAETFMEVHFVWSSSIDWSYIERENPNVVITELAERFMTTLPNDDLDLHTFVPARISDYLSKKTSASDYKEENMTQKVSISLNDGFSNLQKYGLSPDNTPDLINFKCDKRLLDGSTITVRSLENIIYYGTGLVQDNYVTYNVLEDTVNVQIRLPRSALTKIATDTASIYTVESSLSPYPLAFFKVEAQTPIKLDLPHIAEVRNRLSNLHWGVDAIFVADGNLHVLGWAVPPHNEPKNSLPRVLIDGQIADVFPSRSASAASLYWAHERVNELGFYACAKFGDWDRFVKLEVQFEKDIAESFSRRFPVYNWIGEYNQPNLPPDENIHRVSGPNSNKVSYINGGYTDFLRFCKAAELANKEIDNKTTILDWGCGCGRITRHLVAAGAKVFGVDIDNGNIEWCRSQWSGATFETVDLMPPTKLEDDYFDVIVSSSVLSHLTKNAMAAWLNEMSRILKQDGAALLSYNGDDTSFLYASVSSAATKSLINDGFFDDWKTPDLDGVISDSEYYRLTLMTDAYAISIFDKYFDSVQILHSAVSGHQNIAILRKPKF